MAEGSDAKRQTIRDIATGAVIALAVTVVGGLAVYYLTRQPQHAPERERLVYSIQPITAFEADSASLGFTTIVAQNQGTMAARNVRMAIDVGSGSRIRDKRIALSSGSVGEFGLADTNRHQLLLTIPVLAASERLTIGLLIDHPGSAPVISIKSDESLGTLGEFDGEPPKTPSSEFLDLLPLLSGVLVLVQIPLLLVLRRSREDGDRLYRAQNNTGFLLLHAGLPEEAVRHLSTSLSEHGADDSHLVGNLALAYELTNESARADRLLHAATFYARSRHQRAVVEFNRALIAFNRGDVAAGSTAIRDALALSKKEVLRYLEYSDIVGGLRTDDAIAAVFDRAQSGRLKA